jgi:hypothetical protein
LILRPSRKKWLAVLLGSAAFVAFALLIPAERPFIAWAGIVFFGLTGLVSLLVLLPGRTYLLLTPEGFEQRMVVRTVKQSWQQIERFQVHNPASRYRLVGFIRDQDCTGHAKPRRANRSPTGVDGMLGDTYGLSADELVKLMNEWLSRYKRQ